MERPKKRVRLTMDGEPDTPEPGVDIAAVMPTTEESSYVDFLPAEPCHWLTKSRNKILPATPTLDGIPTEIRLQIFKNLLYAGSRALVSEVATKESLEACHNFRSLMLTSRRINLEATELFFKNAIVYFDIVHDDCKTVEVRPGLRGFRYSWSLGSTKEITSRRMEDLKWTILNDFLRKVRSVNLTIRSKTMHPSSSWYKTLISKKGDSTYLESMSFLVRALKAAPSLESVVVRILSHEHYVSKRLADVYEIPQGPVRGPLNRGRITRSHVEEAVKRFKWHLTPFESLLNCQLKIHVLGEKGDRLEIQHPTLAKYMEDLQTTKGRNRILQSRLREFKEDDTDEDKEADSDSSDDD
jgi:hypothetical protein